MVFSCNIQAFAGEVISVQGGMPKTSQVKEADLNKLISMLENCAQSGSSEYKTGIMVNGFVGYTEFFNTYSPLLLLSTCSDDSAIQLFSTGASINSEREINIKWRNGVDAAAEIAKYKDMKGKIDAIVAAAPADYTAKLRYFADYICDNTTYDYSEGSNSHSVKGFYYDGKTICQGYAYMFYTLCYYAGIECCNVICDVGKDKDHLYNAVKINGVWKKIDTCWMDDDDNNRDYGYFLADLSDDMITFIESDPKIVSITQE